LGCGQCNWTGVAPDGENECEACYVSPHVSAVAQQIFRERYPGQCWDDRQAVNLRGLAVSSAERILKLSAGYTLRETAGVPVEREHEDTPASQLVDWLEENIRRHAVIEDMTAGSLIESQLRQLRTAVGREHEVSDAEVERAAKALYDAAGKPHGGWEDDTPRKGIRTFRSFEWEELREIEKEGTRRHAHAALAAARGTSPSGASPHVTNADLFIRGTSPEQLEGEPMRSAFTGAPTTPYVPDPTEQPEGKRRGPWIRETQRPPEGSKRPIGAPSVRAPESHDEPEGEGEMCAECGRRATWGLGAPDRTYWFAPNALWNEVVGDRSVILCSLCFEKACSEKGIGIGWCADRIGEIERQGLPPESHDEVERDEELRLDLAELAECALPLADCPPCQARASRLGAALAATQGARDDA
jgi:hypothetical protein